MKTLKQMLDAKTRPLAVVAPGDTVLHALTVMAHNDVGALLVLDGEQLVGIFSERDYARKIILQGKSSKETQVREIMSDKVAYVTPKATLDECMAVRDGDVVLVPRGHHPCAAPYGFEMYYLNVMAGPRRNWRFLPDPASAFILERDA